MKLNTEYKVRFKDPKSTNREIKVGRAMKISRSTQLKTIIDFLHGTPEFAVNNTDTIINHMYLNESLVIVRFDDAAIGVTFEKFNDVFKITKEIK
ncbi:hypothetical protein [Lactococcus phage P1046]|uniref:Uncharacterized protein n=1 Tax=Lactococcus phage P1046 TaxID=2662294 RepID=A0A649V1Q7_9CAUD|nr:hypothetical protein [Lactococcus phage P1046]